MLQYLLEKNVITGPLEKNTSYSRLAVLKKFLLGQEQFKGGEDYLVEGNALHEVHFKNDYKNSYKQLSKDKQAMVVAMDKKLKAHPVVQILSEHAIHEEKQYGKLFGIEFAYILDSKQIHLNRGWDLKTTGCGSQAEFEQRVLSIYPHQSFIYKTIEELKDFYFIGIQKKPPYKIFIVDTAKWKEAEQYAKREIEFLCHFYQSYGNCTGGKIIPDQILKKRKLRTMSGRDAINELLKQLQKVIEEKKLVHKHNVALARESSRLISLAKRFPKNERLLYQEKIDAILSKV